MVEPARRGTMVCGKSNWYPHVACGKYLGNSNCLNDDEGRIKISGFGRSCFKKATVATPQNSHKSTMQDLYALYKPCSVGELSKFLLKHNLLAAGFFKNGCVGKNAVTVTVFDPITQRTIPLNLNLMVSEDKTFTMDYLENIVEEITRTRETAAKENSGFWSTVKSYF